VNVARDPGAQVARIRRPGPAAGRVIAGAACGCAAAVIALAIGVSWSVAALYASDVAALVFVVWVWISVGRADPAATRTLARIALRHALLSYLYGAVIVAIMVNSVGGLLGH